TDTYDEAVGGPGRRAARKIISIDTNEEAVSRLFSISLTYFIRVSSKKYSSLSNLRNHSSSV
ncbi:hypothetical protein, partial [Brevibacillus sp. HB2.2]|uniref:hypothetical protein n=1 Tax=Brevibacillus sp. HB2.2 TaxID=2738846 RepID=UPI001C2C806B